MTFSETTVLLADAGQTTSFTSLVHWLSDPVDPSISSDRFMIGVDKDDFIVLINAILIDPIRV